MLTFQPKPGSVIYCDYVGFVAPEMVKKRPAIIVSKHKHNSKLVSVVPISTTEPNPILEYHIEMHKEFCSIHLEGKRSWIKCDMMNVVSISRLNLIRNKKSGERSVPDVGHDILVKIKEAIKKVHSL